MTAASSSPSPIAAQLFAAQQLSIGLALPLLPAADAQPDFGEQLRLAALADALGFRALWIRDVPLNSADYPDPVGHLDPWVLLGALATHTRRIALVSGAIVLPLRHPLHIAKAALSTAQLSHDRFILGLGSGDRPPEYAAFGRDTAQRRELFRDHWETVAAAVALPSHVRPDQAGPDTPDFSLMPLPAHGVPLLAVGSGGQSVDWIARHAIGWMTYHRPPREQQGRHGLWRAAVERVAPGAFRAFGVALRLDLSADPHEAASEISLGYRVGRHGLVALLQEMRAQGTHHVSLNLMPSARAPQEAMEEIAAEVLPAFHAG